MRLSELVAKVSQLRPSEYDKDELTQWVNEVEFMAWDQVLSRAERPHRHHMPKKPVVVVPDQPGDEKEEKLPVHHRPPEEYKPYDYDTDSEKVLLIPDQFNGVYTSYLFSKIDFNNAEIDRYNVDAMMFQSEWSAYASWFRRTHIPKEVRHEAPHHFHDPF